MLKLTFLFILPILAICNTLEEAERLYSLRGEDPNNAYQSALIYQALAAESSDRLEKTNLLNNQAQGIYFYALRLTDKDEKVKVFEGAVDVAVSAVELYLADGVKYEPTDKKKKLAVGASAEEKEALGIALYWYGANLGKAGEAKGILSSLGQWPDLEASMKDILKARQKEVLFWGAYRILGRSYHKLPSIYGGKSKAIKYLTDAYVYSLASGPLTADEIAEYKADKIGYTSNLIAAGEVSVHGLNNTYLAETLLALDLDAEAKKLLENFIAADAQTLNPDRIAEHVDEQIEAQQYLDENF